MIFRFCKLLSLIVCLLPIVGNAEIYNVTVTGNGSTYNKAISDGLQQAIGQITGLSVTAETLSVFMKKTNSLNEKDKSDFKNSFQQQIQSNSSSQVSGFVSGYKVLSKTKDEDGFFEVELSVDIEKYNAPGPENNRRKIAVSGVTATPGICFRQQLSAQQLSSELTKAFTSAFTNTRRFSILDRSEQDVYNAEKKLIQSSDTAITEKAKLGNVLGADYILTGKVKDVNIWETQQYLSFTNETAIHRGASANIEYTLMVFGTRQVKMSNTVSVQLSENEVNTLNCSSAVTVMLKKAAEKIASDCIDNIYPMMVICKNDSQIYVNMGTGSVNVGDIYGVYALGEQMIDPYTGESLGEEETKIATLQITTVNPKYSVGRLVSGNINNVGENQICRKENAQMYQRIPVSGQTQRIPQNNSAPDYRLFVN